MDLILLELMTLGLISFLLFLAEVFNLLTWVSDLRLDNSVTQDDIILLIRVVHTCLFLTMIFYTLTVAFLHNLTNRTRSYWAKVEKTKYGKKEE
jgi:hypothetical protein